MISFTSEPLWKAMGREKVLLSDPSSTSDADSEESTSSSALSAAFPPGQPYMAPPVLRGSTIVCMGIALFLLVRIYPFFILMTTLLCAVWVPYLFRINDDVTIRRRLYAQFCQEDHLPDRFRNIQQYVRLEESYWTNDRGMALCTTMMTPKDDQPIQAVVCFCHGYTDHNGFMKQIEYQRLCEKGGIAFCGIEYEGHGRSDGTFGLIEDWNMLVHDVTSYFQHITQQRFPGVPVFLLGESMGGAVAYYVYNRVPSLFRGVIFVCPMCKIADDMLPHPLLIRFLKWLVGPSGSASSFWGYLPIAPSKNNLSHMTHRIEEKRIQSALVPLGFHRSPRLATARELLDVTQHIGRNLKHFSAPFLVLHGTDDRVTDPMLSQALYDESCSIDKTIHLYEGMCHALTCGESDENIDRIFTDITQWVLDRI